ncbi:MAG: hypothetical protein IKN04_02240 [Clostridia bacterium]|nr:hypothetical protein [Clostridia bacterium]
MGFTESVVYNGITCYVFTEKDETRWLVSYCDGYVLSVSFYLRSAVDPEDFFSTIQYK